MTQEEFFKRYSYNIRTDKIGGGGFGTVYKATDNLQHRTVAIKVSEVKTAANGKVFSLKDEFNALKGLPMHPNIANYEDFFTFDSPQGVFDYAVMQYYPDGNLSNYIGTKLSAAQKEDLAIQLLEGLCFLHEHKVVHRDLKTGNILVVKNGNKLTPVTTDFGLSKAAKPNDRSMFSNSFGGGTPRYSSPEQLNGKPIRFNTDLWSYGAVVYELFAGHPLFEAGKGTANSAEADMEIYNKIIKGDVGDRLQKLPEKWRDILGLCLVVAPEKRVKNARKLLVKLTDMTDPEPGKPETESEPAPDPNPNPLPQKKKWYKKTYKWFHQSLYHKLLWTLTLIFCFYILWCFSFLIIERIQDTFGLRFETKFVSEGLTVVSKHGKYGYMDKTGKIAIKPKFGYARNFQNGLAAVSYYGSKWGFIDKSGNLVVKDKYENVDDFSEELAAVYDGSEWGFIDKRGEMVIEHQFSSAHAFHEGLAAVKIGGKWGFIDKYGNWVIKPLYRDVVRNIHLPNRRSSSGVYGFHKGYVEVIDENEKHCFIDKQGNKVDRDVVDNLYYHKSSMKIFPKEDEVSGLYGFCDDDGNWIIKPSFEWCSKRDDIVGYKVECASNNDGLVDGLGNMIADTIYFEISKLSNGMCRVTLDKPLSYYYGFIDSIGRVIIEPKYSSASDFNERVAFVTKSIIFCFIEKEIIINKNGEELFSKIKFNGLH